MEVVSHAKGRAGRVGLFVGAAVPVVAYLLFFFSMEHPPGTPPPGGDGDWAGLGFVIFLPGLFVAVVVCALLGRAIGRALPPISSKAPTQRR